MSFEFPQCGLRAAHQEAPYALSQEHHRQDEGGADPEHPVFVVRTDDVFEKQEDRRSHRRPENRSTATQHNHDDCVTR